MTLNKINKYITASILLMSLFVGITNAQQDNTMYFMKNIPQANYLNPAIQNQCKWYLGAPMFASMHYNINMGVDFNDLLYYDSELDSVVTFLASEKYQDNFIKSIEKSKNFMGLESSISIGSIGFRVKDILVNLDIQLKNNHSMNLPADLARFLLNGNYDADNDKYVDMDLGGLDVNFTNYVEYSIGASYELNDALTVGVRPKFITGIYNVSMSDKNMGVESSDTAIALKGDFTLNGAINGFNWDSLEMNDGANPAAGIGKNIGFGLDLGAIYKFDDKITFHGSIIDLGWISWKGDARNIVFTSKYSFKGIDASDRVTQNENDQQSADSGSAFLDSVKNAFNRDYTSASYSTGLGAKLYLGGTYQITDKIVLGLLSRSQVYNKKFRQQFTFSANFSPLRTINATVSYTIRNKSFNNLGYGLSYKFGALNTYVIIDKAILLSSWDKIILPNSSTAIPIPHNLDKYSIRFGTNLMFGCGDRNPRKEKNMDKPIIE